MSTGAGFNPPAKPACAYQPRMTHAQAVALRDAGSLDPNCVVVITDGPLIGTPGNESPTEIELNPVSSGDIGRTARVHTNFDNVAFAGLYNIDAGPNGTIEELTDHWNNQLTDQEPSTGPHTVHNQFPFHLSGPNLRDNTLNDCTLTGWDTAVAAGVMIGDNEITDAGVHLTGMTAGNFLRNTIRGPQVTVSSPNVAFSGNILESATVTFASTAAGAQTFQSNVIRGGLSSVDIGNTVASVVTFSDNEISDRFRVVVADKPSGNATVRGNKLSGTNAGFVQELRISGTGLAIFNGNTVRGGAVFTMNTGNTGTTTVTDSSFLDGYVTDVAATSTATVSVDGSTFSGHGAAATDLSVDGSGLRSFNDATSYAHPTQTQYVLTGGGTVGVSSGSIMNGARIVRDPAATANCTLGQVRGSGTIQQNAGAVGGSGISLSASTIEVLGTIITQNGPGGISSNTCRLAANISNSATATRGLQLTNCDLAGGFITQSRTGGTANDQMQSLTMRASLSAVVLQGAVDPGAAQTVLNNVTVESGASLTLTDPVGGGGGITIQNTHLSSGAIVTGTSTGLVSACRFSAHATVNLGAFSHDGCVVDGGFTVTATAGNINALANKSFNDWM